MEKVTEGQRSLLVNFIDFRKAFDSIHRPALLKILKHYGLPTKVITIIQKLYDESDNSVRIDGVTTAGSGW